jgi:integrase
MGTVFKKTYTKPLPSGAEVFTRKGQRFAKWNDAKGKSRTEPITLGRDGSERLCITASTYTAKYRDGSGIVCEAPTGCRDERAARSVLAELERQAELVRANVITTDEAKVSGHQQIPITEHFETYLASLKAKGRSERHISDTMRLADRIFRELGIQLLRDISAEKLERWLNDRQDTGMSARTRNSYRWAVFGFCNWCVDRKRLVSNPLEDVARLSEDADRRRKRRAMTEDELDRLLYVARWRPLAEYGRRTVKKASEKAKGRKTWNKEALNLDSIEEAVIRAREQLKDNPTFVAQQERLGWERSLIYKTMVLTGLRQGEIASIAVGQVHLNEERPFIELRAADEKNRDGSQIPIRDDLAADLELWIRSMQECHDDASRSETHQPPVSIRIEPLPAEDSLFTVPDQMVKILDRDLEVAGIPKRDERGRTIDMHALRHSFGSHLSRGGVAPRTAQAAMRHKKIDMTMNVYTDPTLLDVYGALDALPTLSLDTQKPSRRKPQHATGTDVRSPLAPVLAPNLVQAGRSESSGDNDNMNEPGSGSDSTPAVTPVPVKRKRPLSRPDNERHKRPRRDSNPQPPDRQSGTLTN